MPTFEEPSIVPNETNQQIIPVEALTIATPVDESNHRRLWPAVVAACAAILPLGSIDAPRAVASQTAAPTNRVNNPPKGAYIAPLLQPQGVAVGQNGTVYWSNFGNSEVVGQYQTGRKKGEDFVVAGTGVAGALTPGKATKSQINYPISLATEGKNILIDDFQNWTIDRVNCAGNISVLAGIAGQSGVPTTGWADKSDLFSPVGVAADAFGNVYIGDQGAENGVSDVVEKVSRYGILSIYAGEVANSGAVTPGPAIGSELNYPQAVAVDRQGNVYIADSLNGTIDKVRRGIISVIAGEPGAGTGAPIPGPALESPLNSPDGVAVAPNGTVYIADSGQNDILKVTTRGNLSIFAGNGDVGPAVAGSAIDSPLYDPVGIAVGPNGSVYVSLTDSNQVVDINPRGNLSVIASGPQAS
jgi:hypothetical protein